MERNGAHQNGAGSGPSVAVVGGGFGGIGAAVMLRRAGYSDVTVFERGERVGGVWNHNTYPGAACDVPSHFYEFSFAPNPRWSRRYAPQAEIQAYIERVASNHGVLERVRTGTEVTSAAWDEDRAKWRLETSAGPHEADLLIPACGQLSVPVVPPIPGLDVYGGPAFHTAEWRHDVDLAGKRVAVIGTGCSAIQVVPALQPVAERIDVYQRSPGWTSPRMDFEYSERAKRLFERFPVLQRIDRRIVYGSHELAALGMTRHPWILRAFRAIGERQIKKAIADPELRAKVTPSDDIGCKRVMVTDDWYPALTQENVDLVTDRIDELTADGIRTADGTERPADAVVLATGFASHDFVAPMRISGAGGRDLEAEWADLPRAYLGITVPGFPNMFLLYGPNTNGGSGSVVNTIECAMGHVLSTLRLMRRASARRIEVRRDTAERFDRELRAQLEGSVWHTGCTNWYVDENGNDPNQWPWTWSEYRRRTEKVAPGAYALEARSPAAVR